MKQITTDPGAVYCVYTSTGCTVTDTATGCTLMTAEPGQPNYFAATGHSVTLSDADATCLRPRFKSAPAALSLLGGGTKLPAGYTRLAFLGCTGEQHIDTGLPIDNDSAIKVDCEYESAAASANGAVFGYQNTAISRDRAGWSEFATGMHGWVFWGWTSTDMTIPSDPQTRHRVELSRAGIYYNGTKLSDVNQSEVKTSGTCWLFSRNTNAAIAKYHGKIYSFTFAQNGSPRLNFIPCVDDKGEPCMFDTVSSKPFANDGTGQFIAGVATVAQLTTLLRRLPATGGTLTLSLPAEANTPEVAEAMQACHDTKGWTLTVHEYRPAAVATYSLRRVREVVWCRREQSDHGAYVPADGTRWQIDRCAAIYGALGQDPAAYGYEPFDSVEQAAEFWELTPYIAPEEEQA